MKVFVRPFIISKNASWTSALVQSRLVFFLQALHQLEINNKELLLFVLGQKADHRSNRLQIRRCEEMHAEFLERILGFAFQNHAFGNGLQHALRKEDVM